MNSRLSFVLVLGSLLLPWQADAGPSSTLGIKGETLVVQAKHKHEGDDDNHHHKKKGKNTANDQSDGSGSASDRGSKEAKTSPNSTPIDQGSSTAPNAATTNQNVLWGDYMYVPKH